MIDIVQVHHRDPRCLYCSGGPSVVSGSEGPGCAFSTARALKRPGLNLVEISASNDVESRGPSCEKTSGCNGGLQLLVPHVLPTSLRMHAVHLHARVYMLSMLTLPEDVGDRGRLRLAAFACSVLPLGNATPSRVHFLGVGPVVCFSVIGGDYKFYRPRGF